MAAMLGESSHLITEPARTITSPSRKAFAQSPTSRYFVLNANLTFSSSARTSDLRVGLRILESEHESTTIWYKLSNETLLVDRSNSSAAAASTGGTKVDIRPEKGLLRLFDILEDGEESVETLRLTVVVDNSIVEIHANDRFALSMWIKPWYSAWLILASLPRVLGALSSAMLPFTRAFTMLSRTGHTRTSTARARITARLRTRPSLRCLTLMYPYFSSPGAQSPSSSA